MDDMRPTAVMIFAPNGDPDFWHTADVRLLIVDERAPGDRVFEYEGGVVTHEQIAALIADDRVWRPGDKPGKEALALALVNGEPPPKPSLSLVAPDDDPPAAA